MRVDCPDIESFLSTLEYEKKEAGIYRNHIYLSKFRNPADPKEKNPVRFLIGLQLSAVIDIADGGQYLLEYKDVCGIDYEDATKEYKGTEVYTKQKGLVVKCCEKLGLMLRPGIVDF